MVKFSSKYHKDAEALLEAKRRADTPELKLRRERNLIVRKFSNGLATMTAQQAKDLGRTEITNHLTSYRGLQQQESQFYSMYSGTRGLCEIKVDTNNAEQDFKTSQEFSRILNEGIFHHESKFGNFWRQVCGEILMCGGGPLVHPRGQGWLPELRSSMIFPPETPLDSSKITYAFDAVDLTIDTLKKLQNSVTGDDGRFIDVKAVKNIVKILGEQIEENNTQGLSSDNRKDNSSVRNGDRKPLKIDRIDGWWYYEIKYDANGSSYVSATLFTDDFGDELQKFGGKKPQGTARILVYFEKAYKSASDWLQLLVIDSEIGGDKTLDTVRGIAEITYPSSLEIEELLNLMLEGDKIRAKPKFTIKDNATAEMLAKWNPSVDSFMPEGVEESQFRGSTQHLQTPLALLTQNVAGQSGSTVSNSGRGGELRVQAQQRQASSDTLQTQRIGDAYNQLDQLLAVIIHRVLTMPLKPGGDGYQEVKWVRWQLEQAGIDYKTLARRKFGKFEFMKVRTTRAIFAGDRGEALAAADQLTALLPNLPPESRPLALQQILTIVLGEPDLPERLVKVPQAIINAQRFTAEQEFDTIRRRALLGQEVPIGADDIDQDHIPSHLLDLQSMLVLDEERPWDKVDVLQFGGAVAHTGQHIQRLLANPMTTDEGKQFLQIYQQIVQAGQAIVADIQKQEQQNTETPMTAKEKADTELQIAKLQLEAQKFGFQVTTGQQLEANRLARSENLRRQQAVKEVNENRRISVEEKRAQTERQNLETPVEA